jgi:hypothetical protein
VKTISVIKDFSRRNFGIYRNADCMFILGGEKESEVDSTEGDICDDVICVTATSSKKHESMKLPISEKLKEKYYDLTRRRKNISPHKKSQSSPHPNFCVKKMVRPL